MGQALRGREAGHESRAEVERAGDEKARKVGRGGPAFRRSRQIRDGPPGDPRGDEKIARTEDEGKAGEETAEIGSG